MKQSQPNVSLQRLFGLFSVSRQAYCEAQLHQNKTSIAHRFVLTLVKKLRSTMPLLDGRKVLFLLTPELRKHGLRMARNLLCNLLLFRRLLLRRRRHAVKPTNSHHR